MDVAVCGFHVLTQRSLRTSLRPSLPPPYLPHSPPPPPPPAALPIDHLHANQSFKEPHHYQHVHHQIPHHYLPILHDQYPLTAVVGLVVLATLVLILVSFQLQT